MVRRPRTRRVIVLALVTALLAVGGAVGVPRVEAASRWAPASTATIHPGVQLRSPVGQCTANFVFFEGSEVYIGMAAHCVGTGDATQTNGCQAGSLPLGTPVRIQGASELGRLAYSSWLTMQDARESELAPCLFNDFALVRVHPADRDRVNPSMPHWGGPTGLRRDATAGELLYSFGNSELRGGSSLLQPKVGLSLGGRFGGWTHVAYQILPGIPGDSGSGVIDSRGHAIGILSTLVIAPLVGSNQLTDVSRALFYARSHGMPDLVLALGTKPFTPNKLPLGALR